MCSYLGRRCLIELQCKQIIIDYLFHSGDFSATEKYKTFCFFLTPNYILIILQKGKHEKQMRIRESHKLSINVRFWPHKLEPFCRFLDPEISKLN